MEKLKNPHDKLFKIVFSDKGAALDILRLALPGSVLEQLDLESIRPEKDTFIDGRLSEYFSDLIFKCGLKEGQECLITFLLEHKSYKPEFPHVQLLHYHAQGYSKQISEKQRKSLSPIITVVLYHGSGRWQNKDFIAYFDYRSQSLKPYVPDFRFNLIDLKNCTDDQLSKIETGFARMALLLWKHDRDKKYLLQHSGKIFKFVNWTRHPAVSMKTFFLYISTVYDLSDKELEEMLNQMPSTMKEMAKTTFDFLVEKGVKMGLDQGMERGVEKGNFLGMVRTVFRVKHSAPEMPLPQLAVITDLPSAIVQKLLEEVYCCEASTAKKVLEELFSGYGNLSQDELANLLALAQAK